jgi:hypothetical protein
MKMIAFVNLAPGRAGADLAPHVADEARAVWQLHKQGGLRAIQMRQSMTGAVLEFEGSSVDEVRAQLEALPAVRAGVLVVAELIPLVPYTGYESLFK